MQTILNEETLPEDIRKKYGRHVPVYPERKLPETSAVLIPLVKTEDGYGILFEQRSPRLESQPGEICLPGGRTEAGETAREAAVRETCEELLVQQSDVEILAAMDGIMGPAGAPVWPFAGTLKQYAGTWSTDEVEKTFSVPIVWFLEHEAKVYETKLVTVPGEDFPYDLIPGGKNYPWRKKTHPVYFYETPEAVIWGLTAHVVHSFVEAIRQIHVKGSEK